MTARSRHRWTTCVRPGSTRPRSHAVVGTALAEDLGGPTAWTSLSAATIPADQTDTADLVARADGVVAGLPVARGRVRRWPAGGTADLRGRGGRTATGCVRGDVLATVDRARPARC